MSNNSSSTTLPMSPDDVYEVGFETNYSAFLYVKDSAPWYAMSVLLPIPTTTGQFLSFDVYVFVPRNPKERYYQLVISGTEKSAIRMRIDEHNVIHALPGAAMEGRGIGNLGYYSATFLNQFTTGASFVQSYIPERSPEADNWWEWKVKAGIAKHTQLEDILDADMAYQKLYIWRTGAVPPWVYPTWTRQIVSAPPDIKRKIRLAQQNSPRKDEVEKMVRSIYPSDPEVSAEAVRWSGPVGALRGILDRRPAGGFRPSQMAAYLHD